MSVPPTSVVVISFLFRCLFQDRVSLYVLNCPGTLSVYQDGLEFSDLSALR